MLNLVFKLAVPWPLNTVEKGCLRRVRCVSRKCKDSRRVRRASLYLSDIVMQRWWFVWSDYSQLTGSLLAFHSTSRYAGHLTFRSSFKAETRANDRDASSDSWIWVSCSLISYRKLTDSPNPLHLPSLLQSGRLSNMAGESALPRLHSGFDDNRNTSGSLPPADSE